jgi:1-acyl-sn-glycerol-3-phosphate acyltransferase
MKRIILIISYGYLIRYFLRIIVGIKCSDTSFLKKEKQFILIANHNSHLDAMSIMSSMPKSIVHNVRPVAAQDYFGKTKRQAWFSNYFINTLLIQRKHDKCSSENSPMHKMDEALKQGFSLIIFPEGSRGEPGITQEFKAGVAMLLLQNPEIPYIPIYMKNMGKAMPKGDSLIVPHESTIVYGTPNKIAHTTVDEILACMKQEMEVLRQSLENSKL